MRDFLVKFSFLLVTLPFFYGMCATVQYTVIRPKTRYVVVGLFGAAAVMIALYGLLGLARPDIINTRTAILCFVLAAVSFLPLLRGVRYTLARLTPIDRDSVVDISGLIVLLWIITIGATALFAVDLAAVADESRITVADALVTVLAYPLLALSLVGIFITRGWRESVKRLGLERVTLRQALAALGLVAPLLLFAVLLDFVGRTFQPQLYQQVNDVLRAMSSNITNPPIALLISLSAGVGEEILFRGAIQPRLGIPLTALAFAVAHTQYGVTYAVAGVLLMGIVLGYQRRYANTTACVITHTTYNFAAFMLAYLATAGV